ncbi:MAG: glycolate oxidase, partial [Spirochaetes bacterium]
MKFNPVTDRVISLLEGILGSRNVISDRERMESYSHDETSAEEYGRFPEVVVTPVSTAQVAEVVKLANRELIPVT